MVLAGHLPTGNVDDVLEELRETFPQAIVGQAGRAVSEVDLLVYAVGHYPKRLSLGAKRAITRLTWRHLLVFDVVARTAEIVPRSRWLLWCVISYLDRWLIGGLRQVLRSRSG